MIRVFVPLTLLFLLVAALNAQSPCTPVTIAGPLTTDAGDGGPALRAQFFAPKGLAQDSAGNIYVADTGNNKVRVIRTDGTIDTIAGNGVPGFSGDGGPAKSAMLDQPSGLAFGPDGSLYIAESGGNRVRKVATNGDIETVAGSGKAGFKGDGGTATAAALNGPSGLAFDATGQLFIVDTNNNRIRKVDSTGTITTFAGNGSLSVPWGPWPPTTAANAIVDLPSAVAVAGDGTVYIATQTAILAVSAAGMTTVYAGGEPALTQPAEGAVAVGLIIRPQTLHIDKAGRLMFYDGMSKGEWVADNSGAVHLYAAAPAVYDIVLTDGSLVGVSLAGGIGPGIIKTGPSSSQSTLIAGDSWNEIASASPVSAPSAGFWFAAALAQDSAGNLYMANENAGAIRKLDTNGILSTIAGSIGKTGPPTPDGLPALQSILTFPIAVAVSPSGEIYYAEAYSYRIRKIKKEGTVVTVAGTNVYPNGANTYFLEGTPALQAAISASSIAFDLSANMYFVDSIAKVLWRMDTSGNLHRVHQYNFLPSPSTLPVSTSPDGTVYYLDDGGGLFRVNSDYSSTLVRNLSGFIPQHVAASFAVDASQNVYITALYSWPDVIRLGADGSVTRLSNTPRPGFPLAYTGMLLDSHGALITAEGTLNRVWKIASASSCSGQPYANPLPLTFHTVPPCRIVDTRESRTGGLGRPSLAAGQARTFHVPDGTCSIPLTAKAYSLNATVVPAGTLSYLTLYPGGSEQPLVSTLNAPLGGIVANAAIVPVSNGDLNAYATNQTDLVLDVNGYFDTGGLTGGLMFQRALFPHRIVDTRLPNDAYGGPELTPANPIRSFADIHDIGGFPLDPKAFSLNVTVVPDEPLGYLTIWPTAQPQPFVSTLNSPDGRIVANAAIVAADANASMSIFATNRTNVILDLNGYFQADTASSFYTVTPCRIVDTRNANGVFGGPSMTAGSTREFPIPQSACGVPWTASAYALNVTVVPKAPFLSYLTISAGEQPLTSTLNSPDGRIVANAAIVPAGANGSVSVYVTDLTDVVIDVNGYFAP